ncbi:MAG: PAS domain-containing protein [Anaerolineaceae bacterium]|nr:PAS domain-containing protein [Anaerolineaceae bacterium]
MAHEWVEEFPGEMIVCDLQGIILEMNTRAVKSYVKSGGAALIGTNLLDCHPERVRPMIEALFKTQEHNVYTIEKKGQHKIIYQAPWYEESVCQGYVELSLEIPAQMPHYVRS